MSTHLNNNGKNNDHRIGGLIKFDQSVSIEILKEILKDMSDYDISERWIDLHYRGAGHDKSHVISFVFRPKEGTEETFDLYVGFLIDYLKDRFGTRPNSDNKINCIDWWTISTVLIYA